MPELIQAKIEHATLIRAHRERVYDVLTTVEGWNAWFTAESRIDARPGGLIWLRWRDWGPDRVNAEDGGPVVEARRPERFVFQWHPDNPAYFTTVEIDLELSGGGTVVRLREHGYHDTPEGLAAMLNCTAGWGEALTLLKFYVEGGMKY